MPITFMQSDGRRSPPKSLSRFKIIFFAFRSFSMMYRPRGRPSCFPERRAVSNPSIVRCLRSSTSFYAWSKAILICFSASFIRYCSTPLKIRSASVPVIEMLTCKASRYTAVLICGSFKNSSSTSL